MSCVLQAVDASNRLSSGFPSLQCIENGTVLLAQHLVWRSRGQDTLYVTHGPVSGPKAFFGAVKGPIGSFSGSKNPILGCRSKYVVHWSDHPLSTPFTMNLIARAQAQTVILSRVGTCCSMINIE